MDELMRRAAEDYPVKPQGADWEKVAQLLDATEDKEAVTASYGYLKKLLLLLPFILASYMCDRFLVYEYGHLKKMTSEGTGTGSDKQVSHPVLTKLKGSAGVPVTNSIKLPTNTVPYETGERTDAKSSAPVRTTGGESGMAFSKSFPGMPANKNADAEPSAVSFYTADAMLEPATITPTINPLHIVERPAFVEGTEPLAGKKAEEATREKAYISLLMGPDFSRVKTENARPAGYSVGVLGGYNITRHLAVETGVLWDKKNYFSTGEYFKTDKIYLPQHSQVVQVDGFCAMFEFPLNIRYTWLRKSNAALSAAAGVSSYLMKKENYNYIYKRYNVDYAGNSNYKNASKDWFSVANFSMAFDHNIGIKNKIHIEPYVKLPMRGVGIGSLPLRSAGVLVGVTRTIH